MPAKSKKQQRLFGMVHAYLKGELKNPPEAVRRIAEHISPEDAEHFARTAHDGLPEKVAADLYGLSPFGAGFAAACAAHGLDWRQLL